MQLVALVVVYVSLRSPPLRRHVSIGQVQKPIDFLSLPVEVAIEFPGHQFSHSRGHLLRRSRI